MWSKNNDRDGDKFKKSWSSWKWFVLSCERVQENIFYMLGRSAIWEEALSLRLLFYSLSAWPQPCVCICSTFCKAEQIFKFFSLFIVAKKSYLCLLDNVLWITKFIENDKRDRERNINSKLKSHWVTQYLETSAARKKLISGKCLYNNKWNQRNKQFE